MSGKIDFCIRKSAEKNKEAFPDGYPGWILEVTGEDGKKIKFMPKKDDIVDVLVKIIIHEWSIDNHFSRKPDVGKWMKRFETALNDSQSKLYSFTIKKDLDKFLAESNYGEIKKLEEFTHETKSE